MNECVQVRVQLQALRDAEGRAESAGQLLEAAASRLQADVHQFLEEATRLQTALEEHAQQVSAVPGCTERAARGATRHCGPHC